jgi:hypothetical protein
VYFEKSNTTNQYNRTIVIIKSKYRDIEVNFTEVGLHLIDTWGKMEKLVNMTGPYFPDVPGFNLTSIELTTQKMMMEMKTLDWTK